MRKTLMLSWIIGKSRLKHRPYPPWYLSLLFFTLSSCLPENGRLAGPKILPNLNSKLLQDVTGFNVQIVSHPQRIITLAPSLGELAADLLGEHIENIVGVSEYTDYPPALKNVTSVGPYNHLNMEKIYSLRPDLVLATRDGNAKDEILHLRELGLSVITVDSESFAAVDESIRLVSSALNQTKLGQEMDLQFNRGLQRFRERAKSRPRVRVMLQVGGDPLVVVGKKSFLHQSLQLIGGINVYEDAPDHYPRPAFEDVVRKNPDVIIVMALGSDTLPYQAMAKTWTRFAELKAVKNKRVYVLKSDELLRPTLRILEGISLLEKTIYGKE